MRSLLPLILLITVVQSQFNTASAATTTTRRPTSSWIRSKVSRVREWVGWKRERPTSTQRPRVTIKNRPLPATETRRGLDRTRKRLGLVGAVGLGAGVGFGANKLINDMEVTTGNPENTTPRRSLLDRVKTRIGFHSDVATSTVEPNSTTRRSLLDKVKHHLGFHGDVATSTSVPDTTPIVDVSTTPPDASSTTRRSLLDKVKNHLGIHHDATTPKTTFFDVATSTVTPSPDSTPSEPPPPGFFGRAFGKLKNLLHIGSTDPEKPNLVVKYGKKAVEKLGPKVLEKIKKNFRGLSSFFSTDEEFPTQLQNFEGRTQSDLQTLKEKVEKLEKLVEGLQSVLLKEWNVTDSGSKYRLFEERKNWDNAEKHCQGFGAHLAIIDNEVKNAFVKNLINASETSDFAWIGMKTKTTTQSSTFTNFDSEAPIDGCAVMDTQGVWSIRSCIQLRPFVCQIVSSQN